MVAAEYDQIFHLKSCFVSIREDGILHVEFYEGIEFELEECKELVKKEGILTNGRKAPALHVIGRYAEFSEEVKHYSADEGTKFTCAEAYVITSLAHRLIGNFYLKINKPKVPTKIFTDKEKAIDWLRGYL